MCFNSFWSTLGCKTEAGRWAHLGEVGVPEADGHGDGELPEEEAVDPAEGELEEVHPEGAQVVIQLAWGKRRHSVQPRNGRYIVMYYIKQ